MSAKIIGRAKFARQLAAIPSSVREELTKALRVSAEEVSDLQRRMVPAESGALRASIGNSADGSTPEGAAISTKGNRMVADAGLSVTLYAGNKVAYYARLVEFGTAAHVIKAKAKTALAADGKILGRSVKHPGGDAQPFFYPGFRLGKKRAKSRISRAMTKGIKKAVR